MKQITIRSISFILALLMVLLIIPTANAYSKVSNWAKPEVEAMDKLGLIPAYMDNADLTQNITRLDMCRIAVLSYEKLTGGKIPESTDQPFSDTTDPDVEKAYLAGLVNGRDDGKFYPKENLTRRDFFAFVAQFLTAVGYPISKSDYADLSSFADAASLPNWVVDDAQLVVGLGIVQGDGKNLNWKMNTTSEQALAMFYRAYNVVSNAELNPPALKIPYQNLSSWAEDSVMERDKMGLVPDSVKYGSMTGPITRVDMCKVVMLAYKQLLMISDADLGPAGNSPFSDTDDPDIINAYRLDIVSGDGDGKFRPNDPISRQEFFKIAANFLSAIGYTYTDDTEVDLSEYPDSNKLSNYAVPCARLLISIGVIQGDENKKLHPTDSIVCQEALVIFHRVHSFVTTWVAPPVEDDDRNETAQTTAQDVVDYALTFVGKYPYVYGGESPEEGGFDCSGLVQYVYKQFGYSLPRTSRDQWSISNTVISRENLLPGDILYFSDDGTPSGIFHVAIYIGNNEMVHASTPKTGILISGLSEPYYVRNYLGAKRVIN